MSKSAESNFAGRLVRRLGAASVLIDAATGETIPAEELPERIAGTAAGFLSAGLQPGDRILISCSLNPGSTIAYLGAMYAGLVPIPLEDRTFSVSGESLYVRTRAKAVWTGEGIRCDWPKKLAARYFIGGFKAAAAGLLPPVSSSETDLAALMPTSGSTGVPRWCGLVTGI